MELKVRLNKHLLDAKRNARILSLGTQVHFIFCLSRAALATLFSSHRIGLLRQLHPWLCVCSSPGNASPLAIRSTSYCVPCEGQTALLSRLPLGALVTPLATLNAGEVSFYPVCSVIQRREEVKMCT